jgi:predicted NBD/HSP70 family sugar kinase
MRISDFQYNRRRLLKAIQRAEPVARTDLVKLTGLAAGTVSQVTGDFVRRGLLVEEKAAGPAVGRKRMELRINAAGGYVLCLFYRRPDFADVEIVDLRGQPVFASSAPVGRDQNLEQRARRLAGIIDDAIAASPLEKAQIYRVGVVVHGMVDTARGLVHWLATFEGAGVPFAALIEERVGIPVVIDNATNVVARAEHWFSEEDDVDDFGVVEVGAAVTSAYFTGGVLWSGANGVNPEIGHTKIGGGDAYPCYCGASGCLATYAASFGVVRRICEQRGLPQPEPQQTAEPFGRFVAEALAGEPVARGVFDHAGSMLGTAVANLLNDRDPGRIVLAFFDPDLPKLLEEAFRAALEANTLAPVLGRAVVDFKVINADHYRKGCAALALEDIYCS